ncbi:hypothetical protein ASE04_10970 [Rhizobium sp. Root708]|uniref:hypothetical protein n=1 Tax=Rhizobium sp. Root708 TaxID=1736592 RepID=UPI0006FC563F|nr:hypothetical protein [Rhizobium sp. Root708]KRB51297.1 hypothetical protein ASE04_10970 [Rhizobium sp. Root708]
MAAARYREYVMDLKSRIEALHAEPERFQTYELSMELLAKQNLISYSLKKQRGVTDSLFYRRDTSTGQGVQMQQETAYKLFSGFLGLGEFFAATGRTDGLNEEAFAERLTRKWQYPSCAVHLSYRKKGSEWSASMKMLFIGLNGEADSTAYEDSMEDPTLLVQQRPYSSAVLWEWK